MTKDLPGHGKYKFTTSEAARLLGVSAKTLHNWETSGKLIPQATTEGHRRYSLRQLKRVLTEKSPDIGQLFGDRSFPTPPPVFPPNHVYYNASVSGKPSAKPTHTAKIALNILTTFGLATLITAAVVTRLYLFSPQTANLGQTDITSQTQKVLGASTSNLWESIKTWWDSLFRQLTINQTVIVEKQTSPAASDITKTVKSVLSDLFEKNNASLADGVLSADQIKAANLQATNIRATNISVNRLAIGGNQLFTSNGKIKALNGSYFANLDGSNLTDVNAHQLNGVEASGFLRSDQPDTAEAVITFTAAPGSVNVNGGPLYINPAASAPDYTLFGIAVGGNSKFRVDAEGDTFLDGSLTSSNNLSVTNTSNLSGNTSIGGTLSVTGATTLSSTLNVSGNTTLSQTLGVTGATTLSSTLNVTGATTLSSTLSVSGQATFTKAPTSAHTGTWAIDSGTWNITNASVLVNPTTATADSNLLGLAVNGGVKFDVDAEGDVYAHNLILTGSTSTGATTIAGDLTVEGNTQLGDATTDTLTVNPATLTWAGGDKTIDITGAATRTLTLLNSTVAQVADLNLSDGSLYIGGTQRISNAGVGTLITGTVIGSQTFTTNNIADSGSLTIASGGAGNLALNTASGTLTTNATTLTATSATTLTLGSTGADTITLGNGGADTITIGGAAATGVSITDDNWSITTSGVANFASVGAGTAGTGAFTTLSSTSTTSLGSGGAATITLGSNTTLTAAKTFSWTTGIIDASGNVGIGTATPSTKLHVLSTTEQLRLGYDASNYFSTTVGSTGGVTFDAVGAGSTFAFSDGVTANTFASSGVTLTGGSINSTTVGASSPSTGAFTTLSSTLGTTLATSSGNTAIGNATGTFALTSNGGLNVTTGGALTGVASIDTITTSSTALTFTSTAPTISVSTAATAINLEAGTSGAINIGSVSTGDILLGGGSSATGCTVTNSTGALACSGNITSGATGTPTVGYWTRNTTSGFLYPATITDSVGIGTTSPGALFTVGSNTFQVDSSGRVGIGTALAANKFININNPTLTTSTSAYGVDVAPNYTLGASVAEIANTIVQGTTIATTATPYNITDLYQLKVRGSAFTKTGTGTITTAYGLWLDAPTIGSTNYTIYSSSGTNYFGGNVGIGTTTPLNAINYTTPRILDITQGTGVAALTLHSNGSTQESAFASDGSGLYIDVTKAATATNNNIIFRTGSSNGSNSIAEAMRITSGGNVGIGTASPSRALDISTTTQQNHIAMSGTNVASILWNTTDPNGTDRNWDIINNLDAQGSLSFRVGTANGTDPAAGGTKVIIDYQGNVGIGTASPANILHIEKNQNAQTNMYLVNTNTGASAYSIFQVGKTSAGDNTKYGIIEYDNTNERYVILAAAGATGGLRIAHNGAYPITFDTNATERMRIDSNGVLTYGSASASPGSGVRFTIDSTNPSLAGTGLFKVKLTTDGTGNNSSAQVVYASGSIVMDASSTAAIVAGLYSDIQANTNNGGTITRAAQIWGAGVTASTAAGTLTNHNTLYLGTPVNGATVRVIDTASGGYLTTGGVWTNAPSWRALKFNIKPITQETASSLTDWLRDEYKPVTYRYYTDQAYENDHTGFLLDDMPQNIRDIVMRDPSGGISDKDVSGLTLALLQETERRIATQSAQIASQSAQISDIDSKVAGLATESAQSTPYIGDTEEGDLVALSSQTVPDKPFAVERATEDRVGQLYGVHSSQATNSSDAAEIPVTTSGKTTIKVSTANGEILKGDYLTASGIPGVATKVTQHTKVVGMALEDYKGEGVGKISVLVNIMYADPQNILAKINLDDSGNVVIPSLKTDSLQLLTPAADSTQPATYSDTSQKLDELTNRLSTVEEKVASSSAVLGASTDIASATDSALLSDINKDLTVKSISADSGVFTSNLTVIGKTSLSDTAIIGNLSVGLLTISSDLTSLAPSTSLNVLGTLKFQTLFGGGVEIDQKGNIKTSGTIKAAKFEVDTTDLSSASTGSGTIPAGTTSVEIDTTAVTGSSKILITPTSLTGGYPLIISTKSAGQGFTVTIEKSYNHAITFDWFIVN